MSQTVTDLCKTKYSNPQGFGAEHFPVFWKCCNPSKQWNLLTQCNLFCNLYFTIYQWWCHIYTYI